jgi:hypothetical protein
MEVVLLAGCLHETRLGERGENIMFVNMSVNRSVRWLLLIFALLAVPVVSSAGIILQIGIAPPPLPVYEQPLCPGDGYLWTPGYWAYDDVDGYFWVPGTWVLAPEPGFLWTPGYWGWGDGVFIFHQGYWGPQIGFYGGINYGFGYVGVGYEGGYWSNGAFFYNRSVSNVQNVTNIYNKTVVVNNTTINQVSFNGGAGGITARPTAQEEAAAQQRHIPPTSVQTQHIQAASTNRQLFESENHGKPAIAATAKPGEFRGSGVAAAKAAAPSYQPPTARSVAPKPENRAVAPTPENRAVAPRPENNSPSRSGSALHPNELTPLARPEPPNTGNAKLDERFQQEQEKVRTRQDQERQQLQQRQEQEHQRLEQSHGDDAAKQRLEQKHQQETQQLAGRHTQEQQKLQEQHRNQSKPPRDP